MVTGLPTAQVNTNGKVVKKPPPMSCEEANLSNFFRDNGTRNAHPRILKVVIGENL
jgi:hypothetical protein